MTDDPGSLPPPPGSAPPLPIARPVSNDASLADDVPVAHPIDVYVARPIETPLTVARPSPSAATLLAHVALVMLPFFAWVFVGSGLTLSLFVHVDSPAFIYAVVASNGLVGLLLVKLSLRLTREPPLDALGLRAAEPRIEVPLGIAMIVPCYIANIAVTVLYLLVTGFDLMGTISQQKETLDTLSPISPMAAVPVSMFVGIYEEIVFRGFVQSRLLAACRAKIRHNGLATAAALTASSLIFGLGHIYQGPVGILKTFAIGIVLGTVAIWRRNLWACIVAHIGIDAFGLLVLGLLKPAIDAAFHELTTQPIG